MLAPPHTLGVTKLRGVIVPAVDCRHRFGPDPARGSDTVVLGVSGPTVGALVDAVSAMDALTDQQIKPTPAFSGSVNTRHTTSFTTTGEGERSRVPISLDFADLITDADGALGAQTPQPSPSRRQP